MEVTSCVKVTKSTSGVLFDPTSGITVKHFERSVQPKEVWSLLYFTGIDEKDSRYNKLAKSREGVFQCHKDISFVLKFYRV